MTTPSSLVPPSEKFPRLDDRLQLGRTTLRVSPLCQGMTVDDPSLISKLFDRGVNFFFISADLHWPHYESVRVGLAELLRRGGGVRDQIVVAATSYASRSGFMYAAFSEALEAVPGLDHLDVLVAGGAGTDDFLDRLQTLEALRAGRHCGARAIGASFHDRSAAASAHRHGLLDIAFVRYNPGHPGGRVNLFPLLDEASPTLLYNFKSTSFHVDEETQQRLALSDDLWRPRIVNHYRFALTAPHMDGLLASLTRPEHIDELEAALSEGPLDADEENYLINLWKLASGEVELDSDG